MRVALDYIIARGKEPSTWAGVAIFFGFFGLDQDIVERITANGPALISAFGALVAILAPSRPAQ